MAVLLVKSFSADFLEYNHLITFEMLKNLGIDCCALNVRITYLYCAVIVNEKHLLKFDGIAYS